MNNYERLSDIQEGLRKGRFTMKQVVEHYLKRIDKLAHLNAFVEVFSQEALDKAEEIDAQYTNGNPKILSGAVIGIKDVLSYKNHKVSAASKMLETFSAVYTATAVQRLIDAGAIIIGRLNCDEFAMGSSNENSTYGPVHNALDTKRVSGGSSGGSAVAVQASMCLASLGSDTGGSIRLPASFCGVIGLKPSYGSVSRYGLLAYASSFDQIGIFCRHIDDCAKILQVISGPDENDSTTLKNHIPEIPDFTLKKKYRFGLIDDCMNANDLDPEIKSRIKHICSTLKKSGHQVDNIHMPYLDSMVPAYYILTTAEASSNLARYDGVHFGYRSDKAKNMDEVYKLSRTEGFGDEVKRRIMLGTFVLSAGYYDAYYKKAQQVRRLISEKTKSLFSQYDFLIGPVASGTAFNLGEKTDDPIAMYLTDIFTVHANLAGIPGISLPLGKHSNGMPFGLQLMSAAYQEDKLLLCAEGLMQQFQIKFTVE